MSVPTTGTSDLLLDIVYVMSSDESSDDDDDFDNRGLSESIILRSHPDLSTTSSHSSPEAEVKNRTDAVKSDSTTKDEEFFMCNSTLDYDLNLSLSTKVIDSKNDTTQQSEPNECETTQSEGDSMDTSTLNFDLNLSLSPEVIDSENDNTQQSEPNKYETTQSEVNSMDKSTLNYDLNVTSVSEVINNENDTTQQTSESGETETTKVGDHSMEDSTPNYDSNITSLSEVVDNENNTTQQTLQSEPEASKTKVGDRFMKDSTPNYDSNLTSLSDLINIENNTTQQTLQSESGENRTTKVGDHVLEECTPNYDPNLTSLSEVMVSENNTPQQTSESGETETTKIRDHTMEDATPKYDSNLTSVSEVVENGNDTTPQTSESGENKAIKVEDHSMEDSTPNYDTNLTSASKVINYENDTTQPMSESGEIEKTKVGDNSMEERTLNYDSNVSSASKVICNIFENNTFEQTYEPIENETTISGKDNSMKDTVLNPSPSSLTIEPVSNHNFENGAETFKIITSPGNETVTSKYNCISNFSLDYDLPSQSKIAESESYKQISPDKNVFQFPLISIPVEILPPTYEQEVFVNTEPIPDEPKKPELSIFINDAGTELRITLPESITNICVCPSSSTAVRQYGGIRFRGGRGGGHTRRGTYMGSAGYSGFHPDASVLPTYENNPFPFDPTNLKHEYGVSSRIATSQRVRGSGRARNPRGSRETRNVTGEGGEIIKKPRGRPRVNPIKVPTSQYYMLADGTVKRRRGRPSTRYDSAVHVPMGISLHSNVVLTESMEVEAGVSYQVEVADEGLLSNPAPELDKFVPVEVVVEDILKKNKLGECVTVKEIPFKKPQTLTEPGNNSQKLINKELSENVKISPEKVTSKEVASVETAKITFKTVTNTELRTLIKKAAETKRMSPKVVANNEILSKPAKDPLKTPSKKKPVVKIAGVSHKKVSKTLKRNVTEEATLKDGEAESVDNKRTKIARKSNVNKIKNASTVKTPNKKEAFVKIAGVSPKSVSKTLKRSITEGATLGDGEGECVEDNPVKIEGNSNVNNQVKNASTLRRSNRHRLAKQHYDT